MSHYEVRYRLNSDTATSTTVVVASSVVEAVQALGEVFGAARPDGCRVEVLDVVNRDARPRG